MCGRSVHTFPTERLVQALIETNLYPAHPILSFSIPIVPFIRNDVEYIYSYYLKNEYSYKESVYKIMIIYILLTLSILHSCLVQDPFLRE
jgi:hypothetical protein